MSSDRELLEMAASMNLEIQFFEGAVAVTKYDGYKPAFLLDEAYADHGGDRAEAACRAIARAAAEIGRRSS